MLIKRGLLQSFNPATYTASVLFFEATSFALTGVPMANHIDGTSAVIGALCAVLFFDEHNPQDAVIIATFATFPAPPPGRVTFVAGYQQLHNVTIPAGTTQSYTLTSSSGIPTGVLGVLYKAFFTSPTIGAFLQLAPHGASDRTAYASIGNITVANNYLNGMGVLQVDTTGSLDITANAGACTVTLYTYGYIT